jgi:hypothetical protein
MNPNVEHEIGASWDCGAPWLNRGVGLLVKELWVYAVIPAKREPPGGGVGRGVKTSPYPIMICSILIN